MSTTTIRYRHHTITRNANGTYTCAGVTRCALEELKQLIDAWIADASISTMRCDE